MMGQIKYSYGYVHHEKISEINIYQWMINTFIFGNFWNFLKGPALNVLQQGDAHDLL